MKTKLFPLSFVLTLLLTSVALGGEMPGTGRETKPPEPTTASTTPAICEPVNAKAGEVGSGSACQEATPVSTVDAIIFAIQLFLAP